VTLQHLYHFHQKLLFGKVTSWLAGWLAGWLAHYAHYSTLVVRANMVINCLVVNAIQYKNRVLLPELFCQVSQINEWLRERTEHLDIFLFSTHHSVVFYFQCSVYWWKGSVRF